jgi:hypothetical protein
VSDFAEKWRSLTPRQRDALVAEARGWKITRETDGDDVRWSCQPPGGEATELASSLSSPAALEVAPTHGPDLLWFSTSWEHAGPLLEEMLAAGVEVRFMRDIGRPKVVSWPRDASPIIATSIDKAGWPELLALAYVIWKNRRNR